MSKNNEELFDDSTDIDFLIERIKQNNVIISKLKTKKNYEAIEYFEKISTRLEKKLEEETFKINNY